MYDNVGIIGAMEEEIALIIKDMELSEKVTKAGMDFYKGKLSGKSVVVVMSGIGKVNASVCTQILVDIFNVNVLINTGVAGSLNNDIDIADIVVSIDTLNHDMDVTALGDDYGVVPRMKDSIFKADERLVNLVCECAENDIDAKIFKGRVLSGDQFISDKAKKEWLQKTFNGSCAEMEGAAIGQTAYLNDIPFVILRAISDKGDGSATMDYMDFKEMAIKNLHMLVIKALSKM